MDTTEETPVGKVLSMVRGRKASDPTQTTKPGQPGEADRMTLSPAAGSSNTSGQASTQAPSSGPGKFSLQLPPDAGAFPIRVGDVIMTRTMYDFLIKTVERIPFLSQKERMDVCAELSGALRELMK